MLAFEHRTEKLLPRRKFLGRVALCGLIGIGMIVVTLIIGMCGYHRFEGLPWLDAFVNASMLLGGMGPVAPLQTDAGKIFASLYSLYCGLAVLAIAGIFFAPIVHRFLHRFHLEHGGKD